MIGFSIVMWFVAAILCFVSVALLKGNTSVVHGKVSETTRDKIGYGKALGKVVLFLCLGMLCCGGVALVGSAGMGIVNALIVLLLVLIIFIIWFVKIQRHYGNNLE